ncbi:MAG TPA: dephospho-CoA kinase [Steroidobacteraceae bacterium]|jgi:dephospho-CoA kinase|nr:dephospho-CoA kinase [Steroidobacteraceae bacterium]
MSPSTLRVALTGGIASGKSTVSTLFAQRGVPVIDSDVIAREVQAPGTALLEQIFQRFGTDLRLPDGALDRAALRRRVFADPQERQALERLVFPAIRARSEQLATEVTAPYLIHVIPLLVETHSASRFDRVLVVDCCESLQLRRLLARDACDEAQARAMMASQASRAQRLEIADDVIVNDAEPGALASEVAALDARYRALAAERRR